MESIQHLIPLLFLNVFTLAGVPLAVVVFLIWRSRRRSRFLPSQVPKPEGTASRTETIALAGISSSLLVMLACYRAYDGVPYALGDDAPATVRSEYWQLLSVWALIVAFGLGLAWFRQTVAAAILLTIFFCGAGFAVNEGIVFSHEGHEEEIRDIKVPLKVSIKGDVVGADVWFNDEHIGKTPIEANLDEVLDSIPDWEEPPDEFRDHDKFLRNRHGFFRPLAWFHVNEAKKVGFEEEGNKSRAIYARVELNGERLFAHGHHIVTGGSRTFGRVEPCRVIMDVFLPKWLDDVEVLLNHARLTDYQIDDGWIKAAESYEATVWEKLRQLTVDEPAFNQVLDQWAAKKYDLASATDAKAAWAIFEQIRSDADTKHSYNTDEPAGRAVELLLPKLDANQVIDLAEERIASFHTGPGFSMYHGYMVDRFHFGTYADQSWDGSGPLSAGDVALAHAVWQLDILSDEENSHSDNRIERQIAPALIRLSPSNGMIFNMAGAIGGSIYEKYVLRHNWRVAVDDDTDYNDRIRITPIEVNRWLHTAAWMRSEAGRQFRREHGGYLLRMAERILREGWGFQHSWSSDAIDFLFLDADDPNNLAVQFWPTFHRFATSEPHAWSEAPRVRWKYLARIEPHCTVEQFVSAYRPYCDERCNKEELRQLQPNLQFKVLTALAEESKRLANEAKPNTPSYQIREANHQDFVRMSHQVACEASAKALIKWLDVDESDRRSRLNTLIGLRDANRLPIHQFRALSNSVTSDLRLLVLPAIERHPVAERRELLKKLREDKDADIRDSAADLQQRLEAMKTADLPTRDG